MYINIEKILCIKNIGHILIGSALLLLFLTSCFNKDKYTEAEFDLEKYISNEIQKLERENNNQTLNNQKVYIGYDSLRKIDLIDFISDKKLIFYFSKNTCSPCIDTCLEIIKEIFPNYKNDEKIVFISPDYPSRFKENCFGKKLLTLENTYLGLEVEKKELPFFLILNSNLQVEKRSILQTRIFSGKPKDIFKKYSKLCNIFQTRVNHND